MSNEDLILDIHNFYPPPMRSTLLARIIPIRLHRTETKAVISDRRVAPAIIPDCTELEVRSRPLTASRVGNLR